jgi:hypothetical protein
MRKILTRFFFFLFCFSMLPWNTAQAQQLFSALEGQGRLKVTVALKPACVLADADAIALDFSSMLRSAVPEGSEDSAASKPDPQVLLTLEPIDAQANSLEVQHRSFTSADLVRDSAAEFLLPAINSSPRFFGLFICISQDGSTSCASKQVLPYGEIFRQHQVTFDEHKTAIAPPQEAIGDRVYFFRPLLFDHGTIYSLSKSLDEKDYDALRQFAEEHGYKRNLAHVIQLMHSYGILGSRPLKRDDGGVVIELPYYKHDKCSL